MRNFFRVEKSMTSTPAEYFKKKYPDSSIVGTRKFSVGKPEILGGIKWYAVVLEISHKLVSCDGEDITGKYETATGNLILSHYSVVEYFKTREECERYIADNTQ